VSFEAVISRTYFTEEEFFVGFKMTSDVQDGGRNSKSITLAFSNIFAFYFLQSVFIFVSNMNQEHIFK
jgi:hypothetical protein